MNANSRTKNITLNFITNTILQGVGLISAFLLRRVFIKTLGIEFLGISGLFSNILAVLSLAEMGVGSAIAYSMYKEIANKNTEKLAQLNNYYRVIYNRIAIIVLLIGLCLLPFLKYIVNLDRNIPHLYIYYLLEVFSSVITYLFVYKTTIVNADQSGYKLNLLGTILQFVTCTLQIISLLLFKKYMIYILIGIGITFVNNFIRSKYAEKLYPFLKDKTKILPDDEKKNIWSNIKSMFAYKIGGVVLNNTDSILISVLINTRMVGLYSNYLMINNKLHSLLAMFFSSIYSSVGNINATEDNNRRVKIFDILSLVSFWLYGLGTIGFYFCGEDIIRMVTGSNAYVLDKSILIAWSILFYFNVIKQPILLYRETTGLFKLGRYAILCSATLNIILSIILSKYFGLFGIIIATCISRFSCDMWYEPFVLYKNIFDRSPKEYYINQLKYMLVTAICILVLNPIINNISIDNIYVKFAIEFVTCFIVSNIIFFICFFKSEEFMYLKQKLLEIFNIFFKKVRGNL